MPNITVLTKITDYGTRQVLIKDRNKILGWAEPYSSYSANTHEIGKWFFCIGKPSQKDPVQFVCNSEDEAVKALTNTLEQMGCMGSKHIEDVLEDESLANEAFDDRGDYYG